MVLQTVHFAKANLTVQSPRETGHPTDFQRRGQSQNVKLWRKDSLLSSFQSTPSIHLTGLYILYVLYVLYVLYLIVLTLWKRSSFQSVVSTLHIFAPIGVPMPNLERMWKEKVHLQTHQFSSSIIKSTLYGITK